MLYHLVVKRFEKEDYKEVVHILSRKPITLDMMASINSKHEEEKWNYHYDVLDDSEAQTLLGYRRFYPEYDFIIFKIVHKKFNRMGDAPDWVIRRPQDDYWNIYTEEIAQSNWEE